MGDLYTAIQALQRRLSDAGIESVVIGGVAVGLWGDPRATRDADLKVLLGREEADRLLAVLLPDYVSLLPDPLAHAIMRTRAALSVVKAMHSTIAIFWIG